MRVLGVDPGATGALAMLDTELSALVVRDMPTALVLVGKTKRRQLSETWLADIVRTYEPDHAYIEAVHALPRQGVASTFSFGMSYGMARGVLAALRVPVVLVTPQEWKKTFRLGRDKDHSRLIASQLFPESAMFFTRKCDDGRAEAALLALFGAQQQDHQPPKEVLTWVTKSVAITAKSLGSSRVTSPAPRRPRRRAGSSL